MVLVEIKNDTSSAQTPLWLIPNLLSLDAPLVAVAWQGLLAAQTGLPLQMTGRLVLGLTVWCIYIADRLLDVRDSSNIPSTARHQFYRKHRGFAVVLLVAVAIGNAILIALNLKPAVFANGLIPLVGVLLYMALVHGWRLLSSRRVQVGRLVPKEILIAVLFAAGTFVIAWTSAPDTQLLLSPALCFFLVCLANLVLIETWEWRERAASRDDLVETSQPHYTTFVLGRFYLVWVPALTATCLVRSIAGFGESQWFLAVAISAMLLVSLFLWGSRLSHDARRVLADAVLLVPLCFLL